MNSKHEYKIGEAYGMKRLLKLVKDNTNRTMALVECINCGKQSEVRPCSLFNVKNISYSCQNKKACGESGSRLYGIYHNMLYRCYTSTAHEYLNYGGRGIGVCNEWRGENGYIMFRNCARAAGYEDTLTIDRIDVNIGYSPENCRWISKADNTARANHSMRTQHRRANYGTYFTITPYDEYMEFDNANEFSRKTGLNAGMIRKSAKKNITYRGYQFGYVSLSDGCKPQSTIENP